MRRTAPRAALLLIVAVALVCGAAYLPTLRYGFVWDDEQLITANSRLSASNPSSFFGQDFMPALHGASPVRYYRPVAVLSFWLDRQAWGLNPLGFHLTNVLLNTVVLVLFGFVLAASFKPQAANSDPRPRTPDPGTRRWLVLLGIALFGLHPAHVESVAFISGRTDLLAAIFVLISVLTLLRYRAGGRWLWLAGAAGAFLLALLSKESVVLLPVLALALPGATSGRRTLASFAALALTAGAFAALRTAVIGGPLLPAVEPGRWLMLILNAVGRYSQLVVFPFNHRLVYPDQASFAAFGWPTVVGAVSLAGLVFGVIRWRRGAVGLGAAWFLAFLLPASNLFLTGVSFLSERFLYLPLAGAALLAVSAGQDVDRRDRTGGGQTGIIGAVRLGVLCAFAGIFLIGTLRRMPVWRDQGTLFRTMVKEAPESAEAHNNLGAYLFKFQQDFAGAEAEFRRALELKPDLVTAHNNLGDALRKHGELAEAEAEYRAALALDANYAEAQGNLGIVMALTGRPDSAFDRFVRARALNPSLAPAHVNIGTAFMQRGQADSAQVSFWTAVRLDPKRPESYLNLSRLYSATGKPDSAALMDGLYQQYSGR